MPNPVHTYIKYMICKHILFKILKRVSSNFMHSVKWFQVVQSSTYNFVEYKPFVCTQLNRYTYDFSGNTM